MEYLILDLKEKLLLRRENVLEKIKKSDKELNKEFILISSGGLIELEFLISAIDEMLKYNSQSKKTTK